MHVVNNCLVAMLLGATASLSIVHFEKFERQSLYDAGMNAYLEGNYHDAVRLYDSALRKRGLTGKDELYAETQCCLGEAYLAIGMWAESEKCIKESLVTQQRIAGPLDRNSVWFRSSLVNCLDSQQRSAEGDLLLTNEAHMRRKLAPKSIQTALILIAIGGRYSSYRKYTKARELFEEVLTYDCVRNDHKLYKSVQGYLERLKGR